MTTCLCHPCSQNDKSTCAAMFCSDCNEGFCITCLNTHKQEPRFSLHRISEIGSIRGCTFVSIKTNVKEYKGQIIIPATKKFIASGTIKIEHEKSVFISSLSVTDDNRILVCNTNSRNLLVYDSKGDNLPNVILLGEPWDIAIIPGGKKAVVTLDSVQAIQFLDISCTPVKAGKSLALKNKCYGIAVIQNNLFLGGRGVIYILDNLGQEVSTINISHGGFIWYLFPGPQNTIYHTSYDFNQLSCNEPDGKHHFTYMTQHIDENGKVIENCGIKTDENKRCKESDARVQRNDGEKLKKNPYKTLEGPEAMTIDEAGNLYVACRESNSICRLSRGGEFQNVVLSFKDGINKPYAIGFNKNFTKLFVSNNDGECILVFSRA